MERWGQGSIIFAQMKSSDFRTAQMIPLIHTRHADLAICSEQAGYVQSLRGNRQISVLLRPSRDDALFLLTYRLLTARAMSALKSALWNHCQISGKASNSS